MNARHKARRRIPVRSTDGSDLCLQCGLCCDGTLFANINLLPDEREYVESLGLRTHVEEGGLRAAQPCPAFVDGCCSLYERGRPDTCTKYRCGLLARYQADPGNLQESLDVMRLVRSLAREMEEEMGLPPGGFNRRAAAAFIDDRRPYETPEDHLRFLTAFHRLTVLGLKYFGFVLLPAERAAADAGEAATAEAATR